MKLFFKKPGECQKVLGKLFVKAIDDSNDVDVHDRALFYYRLLQNNIDEVKTFLLVYFINLCIL